MNGEIQCRSERAPTATSEPFDALTVPPSLSIHEPLLADLRQLKGARKIVVFGGSFDPLHRAHLAIPQIVAERERAEVILFVPSHQNPLKENAPRASDHHRCAMIRSVLLSIPGAFVTDFECKRPGVSYTVETLRAIRDAVGPQTEILLPLGTDVMQELSRWHAIDQIREMALIVPVQRSADSSWAASLPENFSPAEREELIARTVELDLNLSSTAVRESVGRQIIPRESLAPEIAHYIEVHKLYGYGS